MQRASRLIAAALPLAWVACQGPTAVRAIAYTEVPCDQQAPVSLVVASDLADLNAKLAAGIVSSTRTGCVEGLVGDVVVTPPGAIDGPIAFALLTRADGQTPDRCGDPSLPPSDRSQCIVAKRALRFRSHQQVDVRIDLRGACRGIACSAEQTCVQGACVSAQVSSVCAGGCTETDLAVDAGLNPVTCDVPISAPDTSKPTTIVGTGAGTCTEAALASAVAKGGTITFNCGDHATIAIGKTLSLRTDVDTIIDGGGKVTLDGGGKVRIMSFEHPDFRKNDVKLTLMRLSLSHGKAAGTDAYAAAPAPCSQGFYDGFGGALSFRDGVLAVFDTVFDANVAEALGPDVGGGAISIHGAKKVTIAGSTFRNGSGSNGGAIESLNSELDVYNSVFEDNVAVGNGTNLNDPSKCSVVDKNGQYQTGSGGNGGAISIGCRSSPAA